jgi:SAM-dependent methyltransferase
VGPLATTDVAPLDPRAYGLLAEEGFGPDVFNPTQHRACELVDAYATVLAIDLCGRLGIDERLRAGATPSELASDCGLVPVFRPALFWILERVADTGLLERRGPRYQLAAPLPAGPADAIRARGLATDPGYAPAYELLDEAAGAAPAIAHGEITGERALFSKLALWIRYFANTNPYYALNNRVAARAAAARLANGAIVLEVGAGLGSATEALLEALTAHDALGRIAAYRATEPVAFFRRRAERIVRGRYPALPLTCDALDINQPWTAQGVAARSWTLVWGVNVFHLARELDAVLAEAHAALAPGGWLVVGEGLRPAPARVVGAELPFLLLESFVDVRLDPTTRPLPGFLAAEQWQAALGRTGFVDIGIVPDPARLRPYHSGFLAAAVCGRRP